MSMNSRRFERAEANFHHHREYLATRRASAGQRRPALRTRVAKAELLEIRTLLAAPANDMFANAELIDAADLVNGYTDRWAVTGTNVGATLQAGEPQHYSLTSGGKSVWYRWQAPSATRVQIDTNGSNFDTILAVYTGSALTNLQRLASDDDNGDGSNSLVLINVMAGTTCWIAVDGYGGDYGQVKLNLLSLPNHAPTDVVFSPASEMATYLVGATAGTLSAADSDVGDTATIQFVTGAGDTDNAKFTLVGNQLRTAASLAPGSYSIRVRATDAGGLSIERSLNINLVGAPVTIAALGQWGGSLPAVAISGTLAYVARGQSLVIMDISQPSSPQQVGAIILPDLARGVSVVGNMAYVADDVSGLQIIDVSNPANPVRRGGYDTTGHANAVAVVGSIAYVADGEGGLQVIDVSNPANPVRRGGYVTLYAWDVSVVDTTAYIADDTSGLQIIDVSNPNSPWRRGGYNTAGEAQAVSVVGNIAYVADNYNGLEMIDVSNPASPVRVGGQGSIGYAWDVSVVGGLAYVASIYDGLKIVDVSTPSTPALVGSYAGDAYAEGVAVAGSTAYIANVSHGLQIIDVSTPSSPTLLGIYDTAGRANGLTVAGNTAYVTDNYNGVQIVDVSNPAGPVYLGRYAAAGFNDIITAADGIVYAVNFNRSLMHIIDARNPANPVLLRTYDTGANVSALRVVGTTLYLVDASYALQAFDVSDPANPVRLGSYTATGAGSLSVVGSVVYMATGIGLEIIDFSNPASPVLLGSYAMSSAARGLAVAGNVACIADGYNGVQILDVSNPASPVRVGRYDTAGYAVGVSMVGTIAYVADDTNGLQVIDVSIPAGPVRVGSYITAGTAYAVSVSGRTAYVADYENGLAILRLTFTPMAPTGLTLSPTMVAENQPSGTLVGAFTATDPDDTEGFTYTLVSSTGSADNSSFTISGNELRTSASFDYETKSSYSIRVRVTDSGGLWFEKVFAIGVTNVVEAAPVVVDVATEQGPISDGARISSSSLSLSGTSEPGMLIRIYDETGQAGSLYASLALASPGGSEIASTYADAEGRWTIALSGLAQGPHQLSVGVCDTLGNEVLAAGVVSFTVDTVAPSINSFQINDGAAQRSMVKKLAVVFSEPVTLSADALQVKLSSGALPANTTVDVANPSEDQQTYILTFSGSAIVGGSLADGIYDLIVSAAGVQDLAGNVMTGNYSQRFHRLFGDSDGNKIVNALDYARLKNTFARSSSDPLFNSAFDYEGNNLINALDLARFRQRYGLVYSY